jgi:hypothetical protein
MLRLGVLAVGLTAIVSILVSIVAVPPHMANATHLQTLTDAFGLGNCDHPCWHGIELGKTTIAEAKRILSADPNITVLGEDNNGCQIDWTTVVEAITWRGRICGTADEGTPIIWLDFRTEDSGAFVLVDAFMLFGNPIVAGCTTAVTQEGRKGYFSGFLFGNGMQVAAVQYLPYNGPLFNPAMPIVAIQYGAPYRSTGNDRGSWRGTISGNYQGSNFAGKCEERTVP